MRRRKVWAQIKVENDTVRITVADEVNGHQCFTVRADAALSQLTQHRSLNVRPSSGRRTADNACWIRTATHASLNVIRIQSGSDGNATEYVFPEIWCGFQIFDIFQDPVLLTSWPIKADTGDSYSPQAADVQTEADDWDHPLHSSPVWREVLRKRQNKASGEVTLNLFHLFCIFPGQTACYQWLAWWLWSQLSWDFLLDILSLTVKTNRWPSISLSLGKLHICGEPDVGRHMKRKEEYGHCVPVWMSLSYKMGTVHGGGHEATAQPGRAQWQCPGRKSAKWPLSSAPAAILPFQL